MTVLCLLNLGPANSLAPIHFGGQPFVLFPRYANSTIVLILPAPLPHITYLIVLSVYSK